MTKRPLATDPTATLPENPLRILSLGAGVQSTTLLLMSITGEIDPLDCCIFADTHWEPQAVYDHLDWLTEQAAAVDLPIERVSAGDLRQNNLEDNAKAWIPLFGARPDGKPAMLQRQCTYSYKIVPIRRRVRQLIRHCQPGSRGTVEQWIGISLDEVRRMKPSGMQSVKNRWPLVELRMTRQDCERWLTDHGFPIPHRSSCLGCPFHSAAYWHAMRENSPDEFRAAVEFDRQIRRVERARTFGGGLFLHRSLTPLGQAIAAGDDAEADLFDLECAGMCGV